MTDSEPGFSPQRRIVTAIFEVSSGVSRYEIEERLQSSVRNLGGEAVYVTLLSDNLNLGQRPEVPNDLPELSEGIPKSSKPGVLGSLTDQGVTSKKAILAIGKIKLDRFANIGPRSIEVIASNLREPLLDRPTVEDIARYCDNLNEVPIQALLTYPLPGPSALFDERTQANRYISLSVQDALDQSPALIMLVFRWNREYEQFNLGHLLQLAEAFAARFTAAKSAQSE